MTNTQQPFTYPQPAKHGTKWRVRWVDGHGKHLHNREGRIERVPVIRKLKLRTTKPRSGQTSEEAQLSLRRLWPGRAAICCTPSR